jgi:hypothetical protein
MSENIDIFVENISKNAGSANLILEIGGKSDLTGRVLLSL